MDIKDDTVALGKQAEEDTYFAMVEAGLVPGVHNQMIASSADLETVIREGQKEDPDMQIVFRVPRPVAEGGFFGGVFFYENMFAALSDEITGITLAFDGWADDPREYHQIPEIVSFCQGLLLGPPVENVADADPHIRKILTALANEIQLAGVHPDGSIDNPEALDMAGGAFLIAHAFPDRLLAMSGGILTLNLSEIMEFRANVFRGA